MRWQGCEWSKARHRRVALASARQVTRGAEVLSGRRRRATVANPGLTANGSPPRTKPTTVLPCLQDLRLGCHQSTAALDVLRSEHPNRVDTAGAQSTFAEAADVGDACGSSGAGPAAGRTVPLVRARRWAVESSASRCIAQERWTVLADGQPSFQALTVLTDEDRRQRIKRS